MGIALIAGHSMYLNKKKQRKHKSNISNIRNSLTIIINIALVAGYSMYLNIIINMDIPW